MIALRLSLRANFTKDRKRKFGGERARLRQSGKSSMPRTHG